MLDRQELLWGLGCQEQHFAETVLTTNSASLTALLGKDPR